VFSVTSLWCQSLFTLSISAFNWACHFEFKLYMLVQNDCLKASFKFYRNLSPRSWSFFVYNCMHFCIGVATGIFFLGKQIQSLFPSLLLPFSSFFSFFLSLPPYLAFPFPSTLFLFSSALNPQILVIRTDGVLWASMAGSGAEPQPKIKFRATCMLSPLPKYWRGHVPLISRDRRPCLKQGGDNFGTWCIPDTTFQNIDLSLQYPVLLWNQ